VQQGIQDPLLFDTIPLQLNSEQTKFIWLLLKQGTQEEEDGTGTIIFCMELP
jgi:hypothetical protein